MDQQSYKSGVGSTKPKVLIKFYQSGRKIQKPLGIRRSAGDSWAINQNLINSSMLVIVVNCNIIVNDANALSTGTDEPNMLLRNENRFSQ